MKNLLYFGTMLVTPDAKPSVMEEHGVILERHFKVYYASSKRDQVLRMLDMIFTFFQKQHKTDCVIISVYSTLNFYYAWLLALLCRLFQKPYITYLHGGNLPARLSGSARMSNAIFAYAYANVAPSAYLKTAFEQAGFQAQLIPNFIEIDNYPFILRSKLRPRFLWVRSFDKTYHPDMTIRVFASIQKVYPEAQLCMVGPDKDGSMEQCRQLALELGLEQQVTITGKLSKVKWIALSPEYDVFISTTHFDNTPISVIEAMAMGLPIISTNVGGMPFLVDHQVTGLLSPDSDVPAMVDNIRALLQSPSLAENLSRNARQKVETFDWKVVEKQWLDLLNSAS